MNLPNGYSVELIQTPQENHTLVSAIDELVLQAWRDHEPVVAEWLEQQPATADIENAWVWIVRYEENPVGTCRMTMHSKVEDLPRAYFFEGLDRELPGPIASFNRMSVIKPHDGKGIATFLDQARIIKALELGARSAVSICQPRRADSLVTRSGFKTLREPRSGKAIPQVKWCVSGRLIFSEANLEQLQ